jgi:quercetin dioxygenase-like cupin family protein
MRGPRSLVVATLFVAMVLALTAYVGKSGARQSGGEPDGVALVAVGPQQTVQWGPAPAVFPAGAQFAVLAGDPTKAEPFTVRLRFPDGYKIPPHTHPTAENVTVLSGTFFAGMGARFVETELHPYGHDDFASIPANHAHYAMARGETIVQISAIGPFALTYVNPDGTPVAAR